MALRGTLILWAIIFLLIAIVAGLLGLTWLSGIAQSAALLVVGNIRHTIRDILRRWVAATPLACASVNRSG